MGLLDEKGIGLKLKFFNRNLNWLLLCNGKFSCEMTRTCNFFTQMPLKS